jgi:hypothetical protein
VNGSSVNQRVPLPRDLLELLNAAHRVWLWVGPGDPDLDDPDERERFMADVTDLAAAYYYGQHRATTTPSKAQERASEASGVETWVDESGDRWEGRP